VSGQAAFPKLAGKLQAQKSSAHSDYQKTVSSVPETVSGAPEMQPFSALSIASYQ
jgi:hypothetical protein